MRSYNAYLDNHTSRGKYYDMHNSQYSISEI